MSLARWPDTNTRVIGSIFLNSQTILNGNLSKDLGCIHYVHEVVGSTPDVLFPVASCVTSVHV